MIEYVVAAWVSAAFCGVSHSFAQSGLDACFYVPARTGFRLMEAPGVPDICVDNGDNDTSANVAVKRYGNNYVVTIPPNVKLCNIPIS